MRSAEVETRSPNRVQRLPRRVGPARTGHPPCTLDQRCHGRRRAVAGPVSRSASRDDRDPLEDALSIFASRLVLGITPALDAYDNL